MRIRLPFAGVFFFLLLIAGYAGLSSLQTGAHVNDKFLHFITFLLLTIVFYWVVDTNRRRTLNLTLIVCTGILGVGSEFLQSVIPNGRNFDFFDIVANVAGSCAGLGLCTWYHLRMLERRRMRRNYDAVPGGEEGDLELGNGQESGVVEGGAGPTTLEEEVDNWDENAMDDWDDGEEDADATLKDGPSKDGPSKDAPVKETGKGADSGDIGDSKRND
ncbi:related to VanZ domain protein [Cephalotrichum gorgonifer]|uniref:Related to VanZ domain protein n=1 Tax=Cephalotrichum gorgonifer TaxID=2041049 RepID=A0AAE8SX50_9PEZI|nr:related to VanZ domain protein [Cephalotrichum gorgonifer]